MCFSFVLFSQHVFLPSLTNLRISVFVIYQVEDYFEMQGMIYRCSAVESLVAGKLCLILLTFDCEIYVALHNKCIEFQMQF